ncbi:MAG: rane-associated protein [Frankiales bacterium]|jgi:undecaprenyl-diphosphatase|nr:rane-associated protein [Frankiales bacterium]
MTSVINSLVGLPPWLVLSVVFLLPALEASVFIGLVIPGEIAVIVGGVVANGGALPLWAVIAAAIAGAVVGDQIGYRVGRRYGRTLLARLPQRIKGSGEVERALALVRRRGAIAVVLGRWAAALRALVPGIAGMSGIPAGRFTVANIAGGSMWAAVVATLGYLAGAGYHSLERQLSAVSAAVLVVAIALIAIWIVRSRRRRDTANTEGQARAGLS